MMLANEDPQLLEQTARVVALVASDPGLQNLESLRLAGAAFLKAMSGPNLTGRLQALMQRLDNGLSTKADRSLLAQLPQCYLEPDELVRLFARVDRSICPCSSSSLAHHRDSRHHIDCGGACANRAAVDGASLA
jgi:hypothetical protein